MAPCVGKTIEGSVSFQKQCTWVDRCDRHVWRISKGSNMHVTRMNLHVAASVIVAVGLRRAANKQQPVHHPIVKNTESHEKQAIAQRGEGKRANRSTLNIMSSAGRRALSTWT